MTNEELEALKVIVRDVLKETVERASDMVKVIFADTLTETAAVLEEAQRLGDWSEVLRTTQTLRRMAAQLNG